MASAPENPRPSKAEEMETLSETALAFIKEGLTLEENNQETSVRTFIRKSIRNFKILSISGLITL